MAITYLSGERIQGSSVGVVTPTYETVFSSDDFSDTGSKIVINTGNGTLTWDGIQDGSTHGSTKDLTSISDTAWLVRFKLRINTLTAPSSASNRVTIGMFSTNSATAGDTNQDGIGLMIQNDTSTNQFWAQHRDGGNLMNGVTAFALTPATGTDYYVEIKRLTSTTASVAIFPNDTYGTATETESITVDATNNTLRYFGAKIRSGPNVNGTFDGYIDDLKIYNSVTAPTQDEKTTLTNVQAGTRYEEIDTRKIYYRSGTPFQAAWVERGTAPSLPLATYGIWAGSSAPSNILDYVDIDVIGNATDFGDLTIVKYNTSGAADATRGCFAGGGSTTSNVIDYITIITAGNATDFGDCTIDTRGRCGINHATYGTWMGGVASSNVIDRVTVQTTGNATDFGDLTVGRHNTAGGHSTTRGICMAGESSSGNHNVIDYITIATTGNATDFGDSTLAREAPAGVSNLTRCVTGGGYSGGGVNMMEYVTIDTTGNATDFGDMTISTYGAGGVDTASSSGRGCFGGGITNQDTIGYITISTTGNAADFGDLTVARGSLGSVSAV